MKRFLSFTLTIVMVLSLCLSGIPVSAAQIELKPLPQVGEVISGFKTTEIKDMELIQSKAVLFEHVKTGAELLYIQSKDIDRSFEVTFRTPAVDNTGVNHILEHITVSGSKKYPLKDLLFTVANQTYSTFINAFTSATMTSYPVSSMSEEQLLKLTDAYMDCVYNPSVYDDKNIFLREGWRYEMADAGAPLTINGIVYNEMKGALGNISSAASNNVTGALFPNSVQSNVSGGKPENIKDLTYEQIINTHKTYYHPSNSLMVLYGNLDYTKFLKLINDEYLSKFDKKAIEVDEGIVTPFTQKVEKTCVFPVTAASNTENAAQIDYAFALTNVSDEDLMGIGILASVLNQNTSSLKLAFAEKQLGGRLAVSVNDSKIQPIITFSAQNTDPSKAKEFKALVDNSIADLIKNGFDKEMVAATISSTLLSSSNITEMSNLGINLGMSISLLWANYDNFDYYTNVLQNIEGISKKVSKGYMEDLTSKYIQKNNHAALVTTVPEAGLTEKQAEQELQYLADLKASMTSQEIDKIVSDTKAYNEWNARQANETDQEIVKKLQVVKVEDLPVEVKKYDIKDVSSNDGVRIMSAQADVGATGLTSLLLDTSAVPAEKLHLLQLYTSLLGKVSTENYTREQLATQAMRYLSGAGFSLSTIPQGDWNEFAPIITTSWLGVMGEYDEQLSVVKEILLNTKFDDAAPVVDLVNQQISNIKNQITNSPLNLLVMRNLALSNNCSNYQNYLSGLDYYNFLTEVEKALKSNPDAVLAQLEAMHELVVNRTNIITMFSGNEDSIAQYEKAIKSLIDALPVKAIVAQDYSALPTPAQREAIVIDTPVQYNMISATYEDMGAEFNGKFFPIASVISENYITPKIRLGYGAYDNLLEFSTTAFMMLSYRDPNIKETFDVYKGLPDFVRNISLTQEELDRYILKAFSSSTTTSGELSGASAAMNDYLMGKTADDQLKILREIKSTTVQDVKDSAAMFEKLLEKGVYSTVGSAEKISANKDLYDSILTFGQDQADETLTRAQLFELLLQGVPNPVEIAKQQGLLQGDGKGNYFKEDKLTMEQLAIILNRLALMNGAQLGGDEVVISDMDSVSSWAKESVQALVYSGVAKLDENGNFNPKAEVTASTAQTLAMDLINKLSGN
ncbi:MAG: peptidase M16 [Clostridiaceae bacterium]|nr:peptidase M16 [Clostridiaceae bacterium]